MTMLITSFLFERDGAFIGIQRMSADEYAKKFGFVFPVNEYTAKHEKEGRVSFSDPSAACQWLVRNGLYDEMEGDKWEQLLDDIYAGYEGEK